MKLLSDSDFSVLKMNADQFEAITSAMQKDDVQASEITAQTVIDAINNNDARAMLQQLQADNVKLTEQCAEQAQLLDQANARIAELEQQLDEMPAEQPATITASVEPSAREEDIASFADQNKGNTMAILERAKAEGII